MNNWYFEKNDKTHIITNNKNLKIVDSKNNIQDILITENNIEEINDEILNIYEVKNKKKLINIIKMPLIAFLISFGFAASINFIPFFECKIVAFLSSLKFLILSVWNLTDNLKDNSIQEDCFKKSINELENALNLEMDKLKTLKEKSEDNRVIFSEPKQIPRSEIVKNLKRKLVIIQNYCENKKKYLLDYKINTLPLLKDEWNYTDEDIEFIKCLIENDLNINKENTKNVQKVKKH